jgi:hypothetical protein
MFRDPSFYMALRKVVMHELKKAPFLKIWHAGCSTGEEVYSMAILLKEEGLYEHTQIYATDMNELALKLAKDGIFDISRLKQYTANYQKAGGLESFYDYYVANDEHVIMDKSLKENILFSDHNLATDGVFGEMNLILCRNVLIYFNRELQNRVFGLFFDSLGTDGFLCLGSKDSLPIIIVQHLHPHSDSYLAQILGNKCQLKVKQADEKEPIVGGVVYLAPPNYHLLIEEERTFSLTCEGHVNFARPAVEVLFETAIYAYRNKLIGIILTGANNDGSQGLKKIKQMGGYVIVQAPETAEVDAMPNAAIAATKVDKILPIRQIGPYLLQLTRQGARYALHSSDYRKSRKGISNVNR